MPKKTKTRNILETILYTFICVAFITAIVLGLINIGFRSLFIISPFAVVFGCLIIGIRRDKKKEKAYIAKNVTEIFLENDFFGNMVFAFDKLEKDMRSKIINVPFGKYNPIVDIDNYNESNNETYLANLQFVYEKSDEIIEKLFNGFLEQHSDNKKITLETLSENFSIDSISIRRKGEHFLERTLVFDGESISDENPEELVAIIR